MTGQRLKTNHRARHPPVQYSMTSIRECLDQLQQSRAGVAPGRLAKSKAATQQVQQKASMYQDCSSSHESPCSAASSYSNSNNTSSKRSAKPVTTSTSINSSTGSSCSSSTSGSSSRIRSKQSHALSQTQLTAPRQTTSQRKQQQQQQIKTSLTAQPWHVNDQVRMAGPEESPLPDAIPAAHNIRLSSRDTRATVFSSITTMSTPESTEAAAIAAAAAETATEKVKEAVAPAVPPAVLDVAQGRARTKATNRAVRTLKSQPDAVSTAATAGAGAGPAADVSEPAPVSAAVDAAVNANNQLAAEQQHRRQRQQQQQPPQQQPCTVKCPATQQKAAEKSKAALQTKQKQEVQQQQQQRKQQQPLQLTNQPCTAAANSAGCGSKAAAAPEMTAKAAAMFKTVAASVGAALQQDKAAVDGGSPVNQSPQCSSVPKVFISHRTDRWVSEVTRMMAGTGVLPNHRVFMYLRRPVRPPPTPWQQARRALARSLQWFRVRFDRKARAQAKALKEVLA